VGPLGTFNASKRRDMANVAIQGAISGPLLGDWNTLLATQQSLTGNQGHRNLLAHASSRVARSDCGEWLSWPHGNELHRWTRCSGAYSQPQFYTRTDVVKWLANRLGGAHLDFRRKDDETHIDEIKNYFGIEL
jgi:hypothetical protein